MRLAKADTYGVTVAEADATPVKLAGQVRQLQVSTDGRTLTALGDDGTVVSLDIGDGTLTPVGPQSTIASLRLGEAVAWNAPARAAPEPTDPAKDQLAAWKAALDRAKALDAVIASNNSPPEGGFAYYPPGDIAHPETGAGRTGDRKVYLPDITFPVKLAPGQHAVMNSAIWGYGGSGLDGKGAAGGTECDPRNYDPMQMRDNFCEARTFANPLCPAGTGKQGQSIRPPKCEDNKWEVVAAADGIVTQVTSSTTVRIKGPDGSQYYYLHMHPESIKVTEGQLVKQGDVIGRISNYINGARETIHQLNFQVQQAVKIGDTTQRVYVPVYTSLIAAYRRAKGHPSGIDDDGNLAIDPELERLSDPIANAPSGVPADGKVAANAVSPSTARASPAPGAVFRDCTACPQMIVVPAGKFLMGSPESEAGRSSNEGPQHEVTIAKPFAVGKFAITFDEWDACSADGGCKTKPDDSSWGRSQRPVINVSWIDITSQYLPWLNRKLGLSGASGYRLLTEAEWEFAARAGSTTRYSWGDDIGKGNANCRGCGSQWDDKQTAPVGSFKPNAFGLYDMHGNVWQWVADCYVDNYKDAPTDGSGRVEKDCASRVLRGGSWFINPRILRAAGRGRGQPFNRNLILGFRLARTLNPSP